MTSIVAARAAVKTRLTAAGSGITVTDLRFKGDAATSLPDTPAPFAFVLVNSDGSGGGPAGFGGGRGANLYRNAGMVEVFVFSPEGEGEDVVLGHAETIAAWLRGHRDADIFCPAADVVPIGPGSSISVPGLEFPVSNYQCAAVEAPLIFHQLG